MFLSFKSKWIQEKLLTSVNEILFLIFFLFIFIKFREKFWKVLSCKSITKKNIKYFYSISKVNLKTFTKTKNNIVITKFEKVLVYSRIFF
jgi:hypothetical protein